MVVSMFKLLQYQYHRRFVSPYTQDLQNYKRMLIGNYLKMPAKKVKTKKPEQVQPKTSEKSESQSARKVRKLIRQVSKLSKATKTQSYCNDLDISLEEDEDMISDTRTLEELYRENNIPMMELEENQDPKFDIHERLREAKDHLMGQHLINKDFDDKRISQCPIDLQEIIFKCIIETKREASGTPIDIEN